MIKIENKRKKVYEPHYIIIHNYMIGDADGNTSTEIEISDQFEEQIEEYLKLLGKLRCSEGKIGFNLKEKYFRLMPDLEEKDAERLLFYLGDESYEYKYYDINSDDFGLFEELSHNGGEYYFVTFNDYELFYVDETGEKRKAKIV